MLFLISRVVLVKQPFFYPILRNEVDFICGSDTYYFLFPKIGYGQPAIIQPEG
jgi:hypothetical protein